MMARHKEKPRYSKLIVAVCLVAVIAYTIVCLYYLWHGKPLNDTLTVLFFGCFGIEFASLAFIKRGEFRYTSGAGERKVGHVESEVSENEQG